MGNCNHDREEQTLEFLTLIQKGWSLVIFAEFIRIQAAGITHGHNFYNVCLD